MENIFDWARWSKPGCISNCRRLVDIPTGATRRGRCLHRQQSARYTTISNAPVNSSITRL